MASNLCLMSAVPNSAIEPESADSTLAKPERMLAGFPWVSAIVLYSLSWGWSLLRPNTLYWDDWSDVFKQDSFYLRQVFVDSGRPPWEGVIEGLLLHIGPWSVRFAAFFLFFVASLFLFEIFRPNYFLSKPLIRFFILLFLLYRKIYY